VGGCGLISKKATLAEIGWLKLLLAELSRIFTSKPKKFG
jgi:hypothetical protein